MGVSRRRRVRSLVGGFLLALGCGAPSPELVQVCEHQHSLYFTGPGNDGARDEKIDACVKSGAKLRAELGEEKWQAMRSCMLAADSTQAYEACSTPRR